MSHQENKELIQKLGYCLAACEHCADACLAESNVSSLVKCIRLDRDCADICGITLRFVSRGSEQAASIVEICAEICRKCAEECEKHDHDHCRECAEACRECEEACRKLPVTSA